jgi:hypothetical protein
MVTNAISNSEWNGNTEDRTNESYAPVTLKQRFGNLLREALEGHDEYLEIEGRRRAKPDRVH